MVTVLILATSEDKKMSVIKKLMEAAEADTDVLYRLDQQGDDFEIPREVDFYFICPSKEKAETIAAFLNDFQFGDAKAVKEENRYSVQVLITMPVTQKVILCISGFMACIAELYGVEFDGWGCVAQAKSS